MTDTLRERVAMAIEQALLTARIDPLTYGPEADAAIALIRNETLEEAARVAENCAPACQDMEGTVIAEQCDEIAAAIRALKDTPSP